MYVNEVDVSGGQYAARGGKRLSAVLESLYDTLISIIDLRILASVRTVAREGMSRNQMTNGRTRCVVVIGRRRAGVTRRLVDVTMCRLYFFCPDFSLDSRSAFDAVRVDEHTSPIVVAGVLHDPNSPGPGFFLLRSLLSFYLISPHGPGLRPSEVRFFRIPSQCCSAFARCTVAFEPSPPPLSWQKWIRFLRRS